MPPSHLRLPLFFLSLLLLSISPCIHNAPSSQLISYSHSLLILPSLFHPPCWFLPLTPAGSTRSQRQGKCQPDLEPGGVGVTLSGDACTGVGVWGCGCCACGVEWGRSSGFAPSEPCCCEPGQRAEIFIGMGPGT